MALSRKILNLLQALRTSLGDLYGERLRAVILYGSYARGTPSAASDVDVMVVLEGDVNPWTEIQRMGDIVYDIGSRYEELISIVPVSGADFASSSEPLVGTVRREGVQV